MGNWKRVEKAQSRVNTDAIKASPVSFCSWCYFTLLHPGVSGNHSNCLKSLGSRFVSVHLCFVSKCQTDLFWGGNGCLCCKAVCTAESRTLWWSKNNNGESLWPFFLSSHQICQQPPTSGIKKGAWKLKRVFSFFMQPLKCKGHVPFTIHMSTGWAQGRGWSNSCSLNTSGEQINVAHVHGGLEGGGGRPGGKGTRKPLLLPPITLLEAASRGFVVGLATPPVVGIQPLNSRETWIQLTVQPQSWLAIGLVIILGLLWG